MSFPIGVRQPGKFNVFTQVTQIFEVLPTSMSANNPPTDITGESQTVKVCQDFRYITKIIFSE